MSRVQSITLRHLDGPLPQYVVVHHVPNEQDWNITGIEIYADPDLKVLLADDIQVSELPESTLLALYGHLAEHQQEQRQAIHSRNLRDYWNNIILSAAGR